MSLENITEVVSVECSKEWFDSMHKYSLIKSNKKTGRLSFLYEDIGDAGKWAMPKEFSRKKWINYSSGIFEKYPNFKPDTILIDGRFRVACTLMSLIKFKEATIIIHDFWTRPHYHVLLEYLGLLQKVDDIGVFKAKKEISSVALIADYEAFKYNHL